MFCRRKHLQFWARKDRRHSRIIYDPASSESHFDVTVATLAHSCRVQASALQGTSPGVAMTVFTWECAPPLLF